MPDVASDVNVNIFPGLSYRDAGAAIEWLVRVFSFRKRMAVPGPDGKIMHAELSFGAGVVMLGTARTTDEGRVCKSPLDLAGVSQSVYVRLEDVDAHYRQAVAEGAEIIYEPRDTDYGSREYMARDLEGHYWSFGTYQPGVYWSGEFS